MINTVPPTVDQIITKEASRCIGTESARESYVKTCKMKICIIKCIKCK